MEPVALPTIGVVLATAAIDSINPCAIGVLILMISTMLGGKGGRASMLKRGSLYIFAVFLTYLAAGLGLTYAFASVPLALAEGISIVVGSAIVFAGLIEIKDYFWYGKGFSLAISPKLAKKIHDYTKNLTTPGIIFLGAFVALVELPCTGGPYLAIITLLSQNFNFTAFLLLVVYNVIFVLPLIIILLLVFFGKRITDVKMWKHRNRAYMRLLTGLLLIFLGWLLILIANGTINLG